MTLKTICDTSVQEIGEFNVPTSYISNSDPSAVQLLALANREVNVLRRMKDWTVLRTLLTTTQTASTALLVALPADYDHLHPATWWDDTENWRIRGPATPSQWQTLQNGIVSETVRKWIRIYSNGIYVWPTPGTENLSSISMEYSSLFAIDTGADGLGDAEKWEDDENTCVLDEELVIMGVRWRFLKAKGLPYAEEWNEYTAEVRKAMARDGGRPALHLAQREIPYLIGPDMIPDSGFGS